LFSSRGLKGSNANTSNKPPFKQTLALSTPAVLDKTHTDCALEQRMRQRKSSNIGRQIVLLPMFLSMKRHAQVEAVYLFAPKVQMGVHGRLNEAQFSRRRRAWQISHIMAVAVEFLAEFLAGKAPCWKEFADCFVIGLDGHGGERLECLAIADSHAHLGAWVFRNQRPAVSGQRQAKSLTSRLKYFIAPPFITPPGRIFDWCRG
jgi:hypothetical protein